MSNIIKVGGGGGGSSVIVSKSITQNGTYNASADSADGYNPVIVNVSGGGATLGLNEGKLTLTNGTIASDPDYYYSDFFDCPQGSLFFDFGGQLNLNAGIVWYDSEGVYKNYYQANQRYRTVNMGSFYQEGYKMRIGLPKTALNNTILIDHNASLIYNAYALVKLTT